MATIKKIILLTFTALMMFGCCDVKQTDTNSEVPNVISHNLECRVFVLDSCEYIRGYRFLAHKGNCRFCKERRQKELEELIIKLKEK